MSTAFPPDPSLMPLRQRIARKISGRWRAVLSIGIPVLLLVLGARQLGWLERWSMQAFDWSCHLFASAEPSNYVTVIGITDEDLKLFSNPRGKDVMLKVLNELKTKQPKGVLFTEGLNPAGEPYLEEFVDGLLQIKHGYALAVTTLSEGQAFSALPAPMQRMHQEHRLFLGVSHSDYDGIVRRFLLGRMDGDRYFPSMAVRAAQAFFDDDPNKLTQAADGNLTIAGVPFEKLTRRFGEYQITFNDSMVDTLLVAPRHWGGVDFYSFGQLLSGAVPLEKLRDRLVFVGAHTPSVTATLNMAPGSSWNDIKDYSPPQRAALMTDHLVSAVLGETHVIQAMPLALNLLWICFWTLLTVYLMAPIDVPRIWLLRAGAMAALVIAISLIAFRFGYWLSVVPALVGIAASSLETIRKALMNERSLRDFVNVTQSVLDRLPEPVFVKDDHGRIRLVNEAFCRLLAAEPQSLIGMRLAVVWPQFAARDAEGVTELADRYGRQFKTQIQLSSLPPRMANENLVFGMIRTVEMLNQRGLEPIEVFEQRFALCQARARRLQERTWLIWIHIDDFADVRDALGDAVAQNYHQQIANRLHAAFPTLESLTSFSNDQFLIIENVQKIHSSARELLNGAFSWPITINDERVEAELSCIDQLLSPEASFADALASIQRRHEQKRADAMQVAA